MRKKNLKTGVVALGLVALMGVAGISAYFTATDVVTNNFNIKKVDVKVEEPSYTDDQDVTPNETISKDPTVTNMGTTDQFVFLSVKVPYANIVTANANGTRNAAADTDLFSLNNVSSDWYLVKTNNDTTNKINEYIYVYGSQTACTSLAPNAKTPALFTSVTMCNAVEGQGLEETEVEIDIDVYAIQNSDLSVSGSGTVVPSEVLSIYLNQWNSNPANANNQK